MRLSCSFALCVGANIVGEVSLSSDVTMAAVAAANFIAC